MLERLEAAGFQAHALRRIVLSPHTTFIVGRTDVGKTSLIRALRWLATNRPSSTAHIRGDGPASFRLWVDGHRLARVRGRRVNEYRVDGQPLKAMGTAVPEPVSKILRLGPVNFQFQHSAPFWLDGADVAKELNGIFDLGLIDTSLAYLRSNKRTASARKEAAEEAHARAKEAVEKTAWVEDAAAAFARLERYASKANDTYLAAQAAEKEVEALRLAEERCRATAARKAATGRLAKLASLAVSAEKRAEMAVLAIRAAHLATQTAAKQPPDVSGLDRAYRQWTESRQKAKDAATAVDALFIAEENLKVAAEWKAEAEANFHKYHIGECPLCGQKLRAP